MKKKVLSVLLALVLVLTLSLVMATPVAAADITVGSGESIQVAIDVAGPDDTIIVAAGIYEEDLVIPATKTNLELVGAEGATIKGVQWGEWPTHVPNIDVLASGVKIHGFTIESPDYPAGKHSSGIIIGAANVEIYENSFVIKDDGTGDGWGVSIETYGAWAGDVSGLNIHDNTFTSTTGTDKGSEGIYINYNPDIPDPAGTITIANNTFGGQIFRAITTERSNTTISGNTITSSFAPDAAFNAAYLGVSISSPGANLNPNQDAVVMTGNTINGFYEGIRLGGADNNLTNISVTNNTVEANTTGVKVYISAGGVVVNNNNIIGNTDYGVENADSATLDATYNWWGTTVEDEIAAMVSGPVTVSSWLESPYNATSVDMTASFTPRIGISVDPASVNFGDVIPGVASDPQAVTVTNEGNVAEDFSASIINESPEGVYTGSPGLEIGGVPVGVWTVASIASLDTHEANLVLTVPSGTAAGTYTATLVFWAEAAQ